jgi:hypothetical protein
VKNGTPVGCSRADIPEPDIRRATMRHPNPLPVEEVAMVTIKLVLLLLLTTLGLVWTERHASITHSLISKDRNQRQQAQTLSTASSKEKPSPSIKLLPGRRGLTKSSKSPSTYADKSQFDAKAGVQ